MSTTTTSRARRGVGTHAPWCAWQDKDHEYGNECMSAEEQVPNGPRKPYLSPYLQTWYLQTWDGQPPVHAGYAGSSDLSVG